MTTMSAVIVFRIQCNTKICKGIQSVLFKIYAFGLEVKELHSLLLLSTLVLLHIIRLSSVSFLSGRTMKDNIFTGFILQQCRRFYFIK